MNKKRDIVEEIMRKQLSKLKSPGLPKGLKSTKAIAFKLAKRKGV